MSNAPHQTGPEPENHRKTMTSYIVGFVLSLLFTLIPYDLVIKKTLHGNTIVAAILVFAVLQLIIQLVFFLHLGSEKKPHFNLLFLMSTVSIILLVVVGSLWIMSHLRHNMAGMDVTDKIVSDEAIYEVGGTQAGTCPGNTGKNYEVMIMNNMVTPAHVDAHLCDTITIVNHDKAVSNLNFGTPNKAEAYAGESSTSVYPGRSSVINLTELGTHAFYDQLHTKMSGDFTVAK